AVRDVVATVEATGYTATLPPPPAPPADEDTQDTGQDTGRDGGDAAPVDDAERAEAAELAALRHRVLVTAALTAPVIVLAMVPAWQFTYWQWLSLTLAAPVVVWGAYPFHRAAWINLRHGATTMDTLVSVGTLAAFGRSLYALFLGTAGTPGLTHGFDLLPQRTDGASHIYLEA